MSWLTGLEVDGNLTDPRRIVKHVGHVPFAGKLGGCQGKSVVVPRSGRVHVSVEGIAERSWNTHSLVCESKRRVHRQDDEKDCVLHVKRHCWFSVCWCLKDR